MRQAAITLALGALMTAGALSCQAQPQRNGGSVSASAIALFDQVCLQSVATRPSVAAQGRDRGWETIEAIPEPGTDWSDSYRAEQFIISLHHAPNTAPQGQPSTAQTICVVYAGRVEDDWRDRVSSVSVRGVPVGPPETYDRSVYQIQPGLDLTVWDLPDGSRIHALLQTADETLELSVNYPPER